MLDDGKILL